MGQRQKKLGMFSHAKGRLKEKRDIIALFKFIKKCCTKEGKYISSIILQYGTWNNGFKGWKHGFLHGF